MESTIHQDNRDQVENRLLASLPASSRGWLQSLERVQLSSGAILCEPDEDIRHVYFLTNAVVSLLSMNSEGATVEIGLIGNEGMVGVSAILGGVAPYRAVVHMRGDAFRINGRHIYEEFRQNRFLHDLLLKYTNALLIQIAQSSICNCYHTLQERLCRWLLLAHDASGSDVLPITHDLLARLLGTRRASVTVTAGLLHRAGLIKTSRGQITIIDADGLERMACECYGIVRDGVRRVKGSA
jgi:CRP-like cAMP-binding protein